MDADCLRLSISSASRCSCSLCSRCSSGLGGRSLPMGSVSAGTAIAVRGCASRVTSLWRGPWEQGSSAQGGCDRRETERDVERQPQHHHQTMLHFWETVMCRAPRGLQTRFPCRAERFRTATRDHPNSVRSSYSQQRCCFVQLEPLDPYVRVRSLVALAYDLVATRQGSQTCLRGDRRDCLCCVWTACNREYQHFRVRAVGPAPRVSNL